MILADKKTSLLQWSNIISSKTTRNKFQWKPTVDKFLLMISASIDCNTESCAKPSIVLEELGCKAVMSPKSCCAKRFDCPDFKRLDENTCSFAGKEYKIGEILPRSLESNTKCVETCFCTRSACISFFFYISNRCFITTFIHISRQDNEPAKFSCSKSDCGVSSFKLPGCLKIYGDLNECCSTSVVCGERNAISVQVFEKN